METSCKDRYQRAHALVRQWCLDHRAELEQSWSNAQALNRCAQFREPTMIKLIAVESKGGTKLGLRFSDGASGIYDFADFIKANTEMTAPLADPEFFSRYFIEAGALEWPNGFDLSAGSLYRRLQESSALRRDAAAA